MHLTHLNDVALGETLERKATDEYVLADVTGPHRMSLGPQGVQHLAAPQTQGSRWSAVVFQVTLTIAKTTVRPHRKDRDRGFGHATFGSGMKRDNARFDNHSDHSA